jgi:hypothetical protein
MMSQGCSTELSAAIKELEADRESVEQLVEHNLQDAVVRRFKAAGYTYEQVASDPNNAEVLAALRKSLVADYKAILEKRLSALRRLCECKT